MKIKIGASEIMLILSAYMYSDSIAFSMVLFTLGLLGSLSAFAIEHAKEQERKEKQEKADEKAMKAIDDLTSAYQDHLNMSLMTSTALTTTDN